MILSDALVRDLEEARRVLLAVAPLAEFAPERMRAGHLSKRCTELAARLARHTRTEEG